MNVILAQTLSAGHYQLHFLGLNLVFADNVSEANGLISLYMNSAKVFGLMSFVTVSGGIVANNSKSGANITQSGSIVTGTSPEVTGISVVQSGEQLIIGGDVQLISTAELTRLRRIEVAYLETDKLIEKLTEDKKKAWRRADLAAAAYYYKDGGQPDPYDDDEDSTWAESTSNPDGEWERSKTDEQ